MVDLNAQNSCTMATPSYDFDSLPLLNDDLPLPELGTKLQISLNDDLPGTEIRVVEQQELIFRSFDIDQDGFSDILGYTSFGAGSPVWQWLVLDPEQYETVSDYFEQRRDPVLRLSSYTTELENPCRNDDFFGVVQVIDEAASRYLDLSESSLTQINNNKNEPRFSTKKMDRRASTFFSYNDSLYCSLQYFSATASCPSPIDTGEGGSVENVASVEVQITRESAPRPLNPEYPFPSSAYFDEVTITYADLTDPSAKTAATFFDSSALLCEEHPTPETCDEDYLASVLFRY